MRSMMRVSVGRYVLYLGLLALFGETSGAYASSSVPTSPNSCVIEPRAKVSDACASYADLDDLNELLNPYVRNLASTSDFFSFYRLNLYNKICPFWSDNNGLCGNIACAVTTLENQEELPKIWRAEELSKLEGPKAQHPGKKQQQERNRPLLGELGDSVGESCVVEYDDECDERDYCVPEDESAGGKGDYVSLANNPERFTGYAGEGARQVWEAIYRENCFSKPSARSTSSSSAGLSMPFGGLSQNQAQAAQDFKQVMKAHGREQAILAGSLSEALDFEDECLEKRMFYRIISGMHASISTHLCHDYLNQTTGEWGPNLQCYKERLHNHPERVSNLYFNFALVLRAVGKLRSYVPEYTFCTGDPIQDSRTKRMITVLADAIPAGPQIFDERVMFQDQTADGLSLKEDFRNRFRNVSRIMDCVGCDKCRLWGKIQTAGFGTAMKVLFEFDNGHGADEKPLLRRTELVALINTLDKISTALKALEHFRDAVAIETRESSAAAVGEPSPPPQARVEHDFSELEELDDFSQDDPPPKPESSLLDDFLKEFDQVWRAYKFVLGTWLKAPQILFRLFLLEGGRLFDLWLGKPIRPRSYEFIRELIKPYNHDEL